MKAGSNFPGNMIITVLQDRRGPELGTGVETRKGTTCFLSWGKTLRQHTVLFTDHLPVLHLWHRKKGTGFGVRVAFRLRFAHFQAV